jgi:hypothetical protein
MVVNGRHRVLTRMVLPYADRGDGEVDGEHRGWDARVPMTFSYDRPPHLIAFWDRPEQCPTGRHLWDAIVARGPDRRPGAPDSDEEEWVRFRLRLTCVLCGRIEHFEGVLENERERCGGRVSPVPLRAGSLLAQQVDAGRYGNDFATWLVHDRPDGPAVGTISWGRGLRGRQYFGGRLNSWPVGQTVQARTPEACLRKLASDDRTRSAGERT